MHFKMLSAICFNLDQSKILSSVNGLTPSQMTNFRLCLIEMVENTVKKGEIAHYKQFLLFPLCFQKTCTADT